MGDRKIRGLTAFVPIFLSRVFLSTVTANLPGTRGARVTASAKIRHLAPNHRQLRQLPRTQRPIEDRHAADPAGEADAAAAVDNAADGERAAAAVVRRRVKAVRIPPGIQTQGDEVAGELPKCRAALQSDLHFGVAILAEFGAFVAGFAEHLDGERFVLGWVVVLVFRKGLVFARVPFPGVRA